MSGNQVSQRPKGPRCRTSGSLDRRATGMAAILVHNHADRGRTPRPYRVRRRLRPDRLRLRRIGRVTVEEQGALSLVGVRPKGLHRFAGPMVKPTTPVRTPMGSSTELPNRYGGTELRPKTAANI